MSLWNYNPIDLFKDVSSAYSKAENIMSNALATVEDVFTPSGMMTQKAQQPANLQRYQPVDLYNDALQKFQEASSNLERAYRGMFYSDEPVRPTPTGQPIERLFDPEEVIFHTADYQDALKRYQQE